MYSAEKLAERKDVIKTHSNFSRPPRPGTSFLTSDTSKVATAAVVNRETDLSKELASLKLNSKGASIPPAGGLASRSSSSSFSDGSSSASTVIDLDVDARIRMKSMPLPMWSDFDARVLGMNLKGQVAIQMKNDKINDEFKSLQHSMRKFYLRENPKNNRPISAASLKRGLIVCFERMGVMIRGTIFHVDNKLSFCTLIDVDNYKIHAVKFENILELDNQFNMPAKTIECILYGLELHSMTNKYTVLSRILKDLNPNVKGTVVRQAREIGSAPILSIKTSDGKDLGKYIHDKLIKLASTLHESSGTAVEGAKKDSRVHKSIVGDLMTPTAVTNIKTKEFNSNKTTAPVPAPGREWLKPVAAGEIENQNSEEKCLPFPKTLTNDKSSATKNARVTLPKPQFGGRTNENQMNEGATKDNDNKSFEKSNTIPRPPVYDRGHYRNESYTTTRGKTPTEGKYQSENKKPIKTNWSAAAGETKKSDNWDAFVNKIMLSMQKFSPPSSPSILTAERGNRVKAQLITVVETKYLLCPYFCDRNVAPTLSPSTGSAKKQLFSSSSNAPLVGQPEKQVLTCSAVAAAPAVIQDQSFDRKSPTAVEEIPTPNANVPLTPSQIPASNMDTSRTAREESKFCYSSISKKNMSLHPVPHIRPSSLRSASIEMTLPLGSEFNANILGVDAYGYFIIQICDAVNNTEYNILHASLQDYYSSRSIRALLRLSPTEITNGMIVVAHIGNDFIRCKIYDVNVGKGICVLVGLEEHEFHDVEFQNVYKIHDVFKTLPQRAVKCMLKGLESYMLTEEIPEVFAMTSLDPPQAHVTVLTDGNNLFLVPAVSMTLENGDDLAEVMKINGRNTLKRVQTVEEIQERLALQMQLRYNLLHNNYLTGSGSG